MRRQPRIWVSRATEISPSDFGGPEARGRRKGGISRPSGARVVIRLPRTGGHFTRPIRDALRGGDCSSYEWLTMRMSNSQIKVRLAECHGGLTEARLRSLTLPRVGRTARQVSNKLVGSPSRIWGLDDRKYRHETGRQAAPRISE